MKIVPSSSMKKRKHVLALALAGIITLPLAAYTSYVGYKDISRKVRIMRMTRELKKQESQLR